jgi:hypothetical protein
MHNYILSRATARSLRDIWISLGHSLDNISDIRINCGMKTVFNPLAASGSSVSLAELHQSDTVTLYLTPGHEIEQEDLVPYGNLLKHIIDVTSGPVAMQPDDLPKFTIVYE